MEEKRINNEDTLEKVNDSEMDGVAGGILGFDDDAPDGHEKSCIGTYHHKDECSKSPDGYHFWIDDSNNGYCQHCGKRHKTSFTVGEDAK